MEVTLGLGIAQKNLKLAPLIPILEYAWSSILEWLKLIFTPGFQNETAVLENTT